jgi:hypothetical protein
VPSQPERLAEKGKPGVTRGRKATGLVAAEHTAGTSQPGRRSQEVGVAFPHPRLDALLRVLAVASLAIAGIASVRPI